jgi:hypothetical protein
MTRRTDVRYIFAITIALYAVLTLGGLLIGSMVWPNANAAPASRAIQTPR